MSKRILSTVISFIFFVFFYNIVTFPVLAANPSSSNYTIQDFTFGSGGTTNSTSASYGLYGVLGQVEFGTPASLNYSAESGLVYVLKANVPPAPSFTNPDSWYNKLHFVINTGGNNADITYALQISTDPTFVSNVYYVKNDNTIGATLTVSDFKSYTAWGGATGNDITGLTPDSTYYLRVKARRAGSAETQFGPSATVATSVPSLTFSVDQDTVTFDNLNGTNSYTDSAKSTQLTTTTNASNGYVVTARSTGALTGAGSTIPDYGSSNASPSLWSGLGFGYTTDDSDLTGGVVDRFTNGGPKYAGFSTAMDGDPVADYATTTTSPRTNTITYKVQTNSSQKAAQYTTTVLYIVVPNY